MAQSETETINFTDIQSQLDEFGWAVVPNVISSAKCDEYISQLKLWLEKFGTQFPNNIRSIIHQYNISHIAPAWSARLDAKPVFAGIWGTDKLHTSVDGIAIGRPPEYGGVDWGDKATGGASSLHLDQGPAKVGLHAYQGAVYLEAAEQDDWTLIVLEKSHKFHEEFFQEHSSGYSEFRLLSAEEIKWYEGKGCSIHRLSVPRGGLLLWDSRTVHAGAPALSGRKNRGRWRYVVFVSMTPAIWTRPEDLEAKQEAYDNLRISRHWSSIGFKNFRECRKHVNNINELPDVAKTLEAKQLAGNVAYDFNDGSSNGPGWVPQLFKS